MKILIADDHLLVLETIKSSIEHHIPSAEVHTEENFHAFLKALNSSNEYDLALMDYRMPGVDGIATIKNLKRDFPDLTIALISGMANGSEIMEFMELGLAGFIPKTLSQNAMICAINLILSGEKFIPSSTYEMHGHDQVGNSGEDINLTPREMDVMRKLHLGYANKQIARDLGLEEVTIKMYVSRLCQKLSVKNRTQLVIEGLQREIIR